MIRVFSLGSDNPEDLNRSYDFNYDSSDYLDVSISGNMLDIIWDYSKVESGTSGNEFIITDARTEEDQDLLNVIIPFNNSTKEAKTCIITFSYQYEGNTDKSEIFTKTVTLTVNKAPEPNIKLSKIEEETLIVIPSGIIDYNFNEGGSQNIQLDFLDSSDTNLNDYILWDYSIQESGTSGNEFILSNIGKNRINVTIPTNISNKTSKICTITFNYYYNGNTDLGQVKSETLKLIVGTADPIDISIYEDTSIYDGSTYECNFGLLNTDGINLDISTNGGGLPVVWKYSKIEAGTNGNEFIIYNKSSDITPNRLNVIIPYNQYVSKIKTCDIVFSYYYEGISEESQYRTKTIRISVKSPNDPSLELYKILSDDPKESEILVDDIYDCDFGIIDGSIIIDVDNGTNNLIPVLYDYSISESGTSGNEFIISNISNNEHPNRLKLYIPYNVSINKTKSCNLLITYHYTGNELQTEVKTKIVKFVVDKAPKPSISIEPIYKQFSGNNNQSSLDVSVNITNDTKLEVSWDYTSIESGTAGLEFPIVKNDDKTFTITIPKNESLDENKTCYVTVTCYYTEASEHLNDSYVIGTYVVTAIKGPVISFIKDSTIDDPSIYKTQECSEDGNIYDISIYAIIDSSLDHPDTVKASLNKTSLMYNSEIFGKILSDEVLFDENREGIVSINIYDNVFEENISDYILITAYDKYGHEGTVLRLEVNQKELINYCPSIKSSKVSVSETPSNKFYNLGFSYYNPDVSSLSEDRDNIIKRNEGETSEYYEVLDFGMKIKSHDSNVWTYLWNSKYQNDLIISNIDEDNKSYLYSVSLPYTNNIFKYTSGKLYDYAAIAKVNYRKGQKEKEHWVLNEEISGEEKQFKLGDLWESDLEYIRPYFKPVEKINGYLTGVEIKNFINSKGVVFNRKKYKTIDIVNWYNNYKIENNSIILNITDALIDLVLHSDAFNKAWSYIKDPINIVNAKKLYIQNNILPNIIINDNSKLDVYYDNSSSNKGLLDSYTENLTKVENLSRKLTFSSTNNSYTMNLLLPENKQYCIVLHLQY